MKETDFYKKSSFPNSTIRLPLSRPDLAMSIGHLQRLIQRILTVYFPSNQPQLVSISRSPTGNRSGKRESTCRRMARWNSAFLYARKIPCLHSLTRKAKNGEKTTTHTDNSPA